MKLSFSNIAWSTEKDEEAHSFLSAQGFSGIEIAPTRIFTDKPYEHICDAQKFAEELKTRYGLLVSSMQSIWYGRIESIFGSYSDRAVLVDYTKKAVDFSVAVGCRNLVFGCPKNRNIPVALNTIKAYELARAFFVTIGEYAALNNVVIALEPNPTIYYTNFINRTSEAFKFVEGIKGLMVNVDFGTIINNCEDLQVIADNLNLVSHVHISEPNLVEIKKRGLHNELAAILSKKGYEGYVSVEMKKTEDINIIKQTICYVNSVFA